MENTSPSPKPGPLHAQTARRHALQADRLLTSIDEAEDSNWLIERKLNSAIAHALTSLALTQLNPPPRRFRPARSGATGPRRGQEAGA